MQVVLDTVSVHSLINSLSLSKRKGKYNGSYELETAIDEPLRKGKLKLAVDATGGLIDEWSKTCGFEYIQILVVRWIDLGALDPIEPAPKIHPDISKKLRILGFNDTIDKLILRIAYSTVSKIVVSDESDFWDPKDKNKIGDNKAAVTCLCKEKLGITIWLLSTLLKKCNLYGRL